MLRLYYAGQLNLPNIYKYVLNFEIPAWKDIYESLYTKITAYSTPATWNQITLLQANV